MPQASFPGAGRARTASVRCRSERPAGREQIVDGHTEPTVDLGQTSHPLRVGIAAEITRPSETTRRPTTGTPKRDLAMLLFNGFRSLAGAVTRELARRGHEDFRPVHAFAMRAIAAGADNASELGRRLAVSKQAAAKTLTVLEERGYVMREADSLDARRKHVRVTKLGYEVLRQGESIFEELHRSWEARVGRTQVDGVESALQSLVSALPEPSDTRTGDA